MSWSSVFLPNPVAAPYKRHAGSRFGAPMGRQSSPPHSFVGTANVQQVPLEGDYDPGGAYWGGGPGTQPLFAAWDDHGHASYLRASSLVAAQQKFQGLGLRLKAPKVNLDVFFNAYVETALWSSTDNSDESGGEPLDKNYSSSDFTRSALAAMRRDANAFAKANAALIVGREDQAGHDFWLTRNEHGAGFWDGDWPEPAASILTKASEAFGQQNIYVYRKKLHIE